MFDGRRASYSQSVSVVQAIAGDRVSTIDIRANESMHVAWLCLCRRTAASTSPSSTLHTALLVGEAPSEGLADYPSIRDPVSCGQWIRFCMPNLYYQGRVSYSRSGYYIWTLIC